MPLFSYDPTLNFQKSILGFQERDDHSDLSTPSWPLIFCWPVELDDHKTAFTGQQSRGQGEKGAIPKPHKSQFSWGGRAKPTKCTWNTCNFLVRSDRVLFIMTHDKSSPFMSSSSDEAIFLRKNANDDMSQENASPSRQEWPAGADSSDPSNLVEIYSILFGTKHSRNKAILSVRLRNEEQELTNKWT